MSIFPGSLIRECCRRMKMMNTRFEFSGTVEDLPSSKLSHEHVSDEPQGLSRMDDEGSHHDHQEPVPHQDPIEMEVAGSSKR